jgi:hypothetical protein
MVIIYYFLWHCITLRAMASLFTRFLDHTHATDGRTPLGWVISSSQEPLPDNTQQTNIHAAGGNRTHDRSRRAGRAATGTGLLQMIYPKKARISQFGTRDISVSKTHTASIFRGKLIWWHQVIQTLVLVLYGAPLNNILIFASTRS